MLSTLISLLTLPLMVKMKQFKLTLFKRLFLSTKVSSACTKRACVAELFELGWFLAKLGRENVAVLVKGNVLPPSDFNGIAYIPADNISWQIDLCKEFRAAGVSFDPLALFQ
jgi:predicted nucleotide-binding protein